MANQQNIDDPEFTAMRDVYSALKDLENEAQNRVLDYVFRRLGLKSDSPLALPDTHRRSPSDSSGALEQEMKEGQPKDIEKIDDATLSNAVEPDLEGISPVAVRWMKRNSLTSSQLSALYSLGVDEIDLVAKSVPGKSIRDRAHSVLLLAGVAAYLSTGVARMTDDKVREACRHYDAYDGPNFAKIFKAFAAEVSGTRESGYTLTARGLTAATELIRQMVASK